MTDEAIRLVQELGFPVAVALGCMLMLGWVVKYILKEKVEDTLTRFDARHDHLLKEIDEISYVLYSYLTGLNVKCQPVAVLR